MKLTLSGYLGKATAYGQKVISRVIPPEKIKVLTATSDDETWQGPANVSIAEILIIAGIGNTDSVQLSLYEAVDTDNYMDLLKKDSVGFGGISFSDLHFKFTKSGDKIHIFYTLADEDEEETV